ncbi:MAG TPA: hypothetical protein VEK08_04110 [Planctomycetota bacterium]|nr:hypothetical protein [Planctomycetota bacterium]
MNRRLARYYFIALLLLAPLARAEEADDDPTEAGSSVVSLDKPEVSLDTPAPQSQFLPPNAEELWKKAKARAYDSTDEHGGGFFNTAELVGEGFRKATKFQAERFSEGDSGGDLIYAVAADEAVKEGQKFVLTRMRLVHFIGLDAHQKSAAAKKERNKPGARKEEAPKKTRAAKPSKAEPPPRDNSIPLGGRVVITAPQAIIDIKTNEGLAKGKVTVEVFSRISPEAPEKLVASMTSERLRWRTWGEAAVGSTEMAIYTCSEQEDEPDPLVQGTYYMHLPDGTTTTIVVEGRGMVYETGIFTDRMNEVADEDGRIAGLSNVTRNRVIFRREIKMETTAATMAAFEMFKGSAAKGAAPKENASPVQSRTVVQCDGPAEFDLAAVPRKKGAADGAPQQIELARRFDFLNHVRMKKVTAADASSASSAPADTEMSCNHLRLLYAPGAMPSPNTPPEYAEAIGGVKMLGADPGSDPAQKAPPIPFSIICNRLYFDGPSDSLFLVGENNAPAQIRHGTKGDASAREFCYRKNTQTLTMPASGPKRLVIRPGAAASMSTGAEKAQGPLDLGGAETIITWSGPLSREIKHLPVPGAPDRIKEILTLQDNVAILQPKGSLKMHGQKIRVVRNAGGDVEFLEAIGKADASLGDLQAIGERVTVDVAFGKDGTLVKNVTTVIGSRAKRAKATLFMQGSAIRSDKFVIDVIKNTFSSFGGAVAVIRNAATAKTADAKPDTAQGAKGLIKDITFDPGSAFFVQCDGEFMQDGATNTVTIRKNVILRQPDLQLLADEVVIKLKDDPSAANAGSVKTPAGDLFSGGLSSIDCRGAVELTTKDQLMQCDRLFRDVVAEKSLLEMSDPENDVRVYLSQENGGSRLLSVRKSLTLDGKTGTFNPGGMLLMLPYRGAAPAARGKENSPARLKSATTGGEKK